MSGTSPSQNACNIHFRNIRTVFNYAIDDGLTTAYPFRKFKIRPVATAKRSLSVEQLRILFSFPIKPHMEKYLDRYRNYKDYTKRLNENLQWMGGTSTDKHGKKTFRPLSPDITTYYNNKK